MQRRLFKTDQVEIVHDEDLQGQCYVVHKRDTDAIDEWVQHDDHYYVNQQARSSKPKSLDDLQDWPKSELNSCKKCLDERVELLERRTLLLQRHGCLRGLELFSGKTLLARMFYCHNDPGLQEPVVSGPALICPALWKLDGRSNFRPVQHELTSKSSLLPVPLGLTNVLCRRNHPKTIVYNQCTNLCLQHAIDTLENKKPKPLLSLDDKKPLPPMPKPGDVDFIYGGS